MFLQKQRFLKLRDKVTSSINTQIYVTPISAGQRKVQLCTLLQVWLYGDSSNRNTFTAYLHLK
jgi:hypothetical protein